MDDAAGMGSDLSLPIEDASGEGVSELIDKLKPGYVLARFRGGDVDGHEMVLPIYTDGLPCERIKFPDVKGLKAVPGVQPRPWIRSLVYRRMAEADDGAFIYAFEDEGEEEVIHVRRGQRYGTLIGNDIFWDDGEIEVGSRRHEGEDEE